VKITTQLHPLGDLDEVSLLSERREGKRRRVESLAASETENN
jgi:hypothetical protein